MNEEYCTGGRYAWRYLDRYIPILGIIGRIFARFQNAMPLYGGLQSIFFGKNRSVFHNFTTFVVSSLYTNPVRRT